MRTTDNLGLKITEGNDDWRDIFDDNADNMDTLDGLADVIAPQYDPEDSYFAGDYCMYQGKTYQALVDVDEEAWTAAHWQEVAIMDEIHNANFRGDQMDEGLAYVAVKSGNNWQLPSGKNAVAGEYIILYGVLGRATSAITGGTTNITSSNWQAVSNGALNVQNNAIKSLEGSIAHIVGNTNSTGASLAVGDYVYVTGHSTIADGLRKVTSVIASGVSITTTNTSEVSGGIGSEVASLNSNLSPSISSPAMNSARATLTSGGCITIGKMVIVNIVVTAIYTASNSPTVCYLPEPAADAALSCIDITRGIETAIEGAVPCGVSSSSGYMYIKTITNGNIYAITGAYIKG